MSHNCLVVVPTFLGIVTFGSVLLTEFPGMMNAADLAPRLKDLWETVEVASSSRIDPLVEREPVEEIKVKRTKAQRVLTAACGSALGVLLAVPLGGLIAGAAGADSTCYTGCSTTRPP